MWKFYNTGLFSPLVFCHQRIPDSQMLFIPFILDGQNCLSPHYYCHLWIQIVCHLHDIPTLKVFQNTPVYDRSPVFPLLISHTASKPGFFFISEAGHLPYSSFVHSHLKCWHIFLQTVASSHFSSFTTSSLDGWIMYS